MACAALPCPADKLPPFGEAVAIIEMARAEASKRARGLRHPQLCLDAIQAGVERGGHAGLAKEGEAFAAAASLDVHKALVHIFFAQRSTKKVKGVTDAGGAVVERCSPVWLHHHTAFQPRGRRAPWRCVLQRLGCQLSGSCVPHWLPCNTLMRWRAAPRGGRGAACC